MSELVKFAGGGLPANPDALAKGLQNVNQSLQAGAGGTPFLRLLKSGRYAYGAENIEPEEGSEWAVNPYSIEHGYACWSDGELLGETMVPFNQPIPNRAELPQFDAPWKQQVGMMMQCLNGEDEGVTVLYRGTSLGLINASKDLINQILAQVQTDPKHIVPVLDLLVDSYIHKKHGEIFTPVLDILKWISIETGEDEPEPEDDGDDAAAEAPGDDDEVIEGESEEISEPAPEPRRRRRGGNKKTSARGTSKKKTGTTKRRTRRSAK